MEKRLVYDLPTRVLHWLFAGLFITAYGIANLVDDDSALFVFHMMAGLTLSFVVILRLGWGFVGTPHARFTDFALRPKDLINYFKGILTGSQRRWAGHNPASSWAALVMMGLALGLGVTGYLMSTGGKETFEDIHEILANAFAITVVLHVAGILLHTLRHKEMIGLSMVSGHKERIRPVDSIQSPKTVMGLLILAVVVAFGMNLYRNYDSTQGSLQLFGTKLQLGESEADGHDQGELMIEESSDID